MTGEEIRNEREGLLKHINLLHERLNMLQEECKHENTFEGDWSWRLGSSDKAIICKDCGAFIKLVNSPKIDCITYLVDWMHYNNK